MHKFKVSFLLLVAILLLAHNVMAENVPINNFPVYRDGMLIVPRVDTDQQASIFHNGLFKYDPATGTWRLEEFQIADMGSIF